MLSSRRFWLALGVSLLFLGFFLLRIDLAETWEKLGDADYSLLLPALVAYFAAVFFRAMRWQHLLAPMKVLSIRRLYPIVVVGYMANNILPVRLGEVVRAYYIGEKERVSKTTALATIAVERVLDGLTLLFFAAVASLSLPLVGLLHGLGDKAGVPWVLLALTMSTPFVVVAAVMIVASSSPPWLGRLVERVVLVLPHQVRPKVARLVYLFVEGLAVLRSPRRLFVVFLLSLPVWLFEALMYYIIGLSFGLEDFFSPAEMWAVVLLVTATSNLATSIPAAGGGIGTFEVAAAATLTLLDVNPAVAGAYTIVLHVALLVPVTLLGLVYLWLDNLSLAQLTRRSRAAPEAFQFDPTATPREAEDTP